MKTHVCRHKTKAGCKFCGRCFACCNCQVVMHKFIKHAHRYQKREKWFIGGFLEYLIDDLERYFDGR